MRCGHACACKTVEVCSPDVRGEVKFLIIRSRDLRSIDSQTCKERISAAPGGGSGTLGGSVTRGKTESGCRRHALWACLRLQDGRGLLSRRSG